MFLALARRLSIPAGVLVLASARMLDSVGNSIALIALTRIVDEVPSEGVQIPLNTRLSVVVSAFGIVLAVSQPLLGRVADRVGSARQMILFGSAGCAVATFLLGFSTSYWHALALRCLQGVALAATVPTTIAEIGRMAHPERRGAAMGLFNSLQLVGFAVGPLLGGALLTWTSTRQTCLLGAIPGMLAVLTTWTAFRSETVEPEPPREGGLAERAAPSASGDSARPVLAEPNPRAAASTFLLLATVYFHAACCLSMLISLEHEFRERLGLTPLAFTVAFSSMILARLGLDIPMGRLSDRVGRRLLIVGGLLVLSPATLALGFAPNAVALTAARVLMGAGMSMLSGASYALAADLMRGRASGARVGTMTSGFGLGLAFGPLIAAALADHVSFGAPFEFFSLVGVALAVVAWHRIPRPSAGRLA